MVIAATSAIKYKVNDMKAIMLVGKLQINDIGRELALNMMGGTYNPVERVARGTTVSIQLVSPDMDVKRAVEGREYCTFMEHGSAISPAFTVEQRARISARVRL